MDVPQPIENLLRLAQIAETHGEPDLAAWLGEGLRRYLFDRKTLEQALGAAGGRGKRTARQQYLQMRRNQALRAAWGLCDGDTPWQRTLTLATEINRFQAILWPRWRDRDAPPENVSDLRHALFVAHQCGDVPVSISQLDDICTSPMNDPYRSENHTAMLKMNPPQEATHGKQDF